MTKINPTITTSAGTTLTGLRFNAADVQSLRYYVDGDTDENHINAVRADFREMSLPGEDTTTAHGNGQELLDANAFQISTDGGTNWQNFSGWANAVNLGAIVADDYVAFQLRIDPALDLETIGTVGVGLAIRILPT